MRGQFLSEVADELIERGFRCAFDDPLVLREAGMRDAQIDEPAVITSDHGRNDCFGDQERCPKFLSDSMFESIDAQSGEGSALVWSSSVMYQHLNGTPVVGDRVGHLGDIFGASEISLHDKGVAAVIVDGVGYVMGFDGVVFVMDSDPIATLANNAALAAPIPRLAPVIRAIRPFPRTVAGVVVVGVMFMRLRRPGPARCGLACWVYRHAGPSGCRRGRRFKVGQRRQGVGGPSAGRGEPRGERFELDGGHSSTLPFRTPLRPRKPPGFWGRSLASGGGVG